MTVTSSIELNQRLRKLEIENEQLRLRLLTSKYCPDLQLMSGKDDVNSIYTNIVNEVDVPILIVDRNTNVFTINKAFLNLIGIHSEKSESELNIEMLLLKSVSKFSKKDQELLTKKVSLVYEETFKDVNGKKVTVLIKKNRLCNENDKTLVISTFTILNELRNCESELRKKEQKVIALQNDKSALEKEVYSGIKGSLQTVNSLINLQARLASNDDSFSNMKRVQNWVLVMTAIHEYLYNFNSTVGVEINGYFRKIGEQIIYLQELNRAVKSIEISGQKVYLNMNIIKPLGLIFNELVAINSSHLGASKNGGKIKVEYQIKSNHDLQIKLIYSKYTNGILEQVKNEVLNSELITLLIEQLHGNMVVKYNYEQDVGVLMTFSKMKYRLRQRK